MANEATVRSSLAIKKDDSTGNIDWRSTKTAFRADVSGAKGPTPGAVTVPTWGVDIDLSELTTPGFCEIQNLDPTDGTGNYISYGIKDPEAAKYYPLGEVGPGESYTIKLSRDIEQEAGTGSGTGTSGPSTNKLHLRANAQSVDAVVSAFEA